jgi:flagellar FliJ protein
MKKFVFRLQTKLDLVRRQEDQAKENLRLKQTRYQRELASLHSLHQKMRSLEAKWRDFNGKILSVDELILYRRYKEILNERIVLQQEKVYECSLLVEEARKVLLEILKEKKTLEKLRARQYREYWREVMRQEQILIDEVAVRGFYLASRETG